MNILIKIIYLIGFRLNIIAFIVYYRDFNTLWDVIFSTVIFFSKGSNCYSLNVTVYVITKK